MGSILNVLIADDSPTSRQLMTYLINSAPDMRVIGEAYNGKQAVQLTHELHPDVILMDVVMPNMNGLEATHEIMSSTPTPIVMVSAGLESDETDVAFQAIRSGALSVLKKPVGFKHEDYPAQSLALINTVRAMAGVHVIHHWKADAEAYRQSVKRPVRKDHAQPEIVAIASSTGGPAALSEIFKRLPATFGLPIVIVQHISAEFLPSLVDWLGATTPLKVEVARPGESPLAGHIYFAPGDAHLRVSKYHRFEPDRTTRMTYTPSGDILLESIAAAYGSSAVGVVLTGMGNDGAHGLLAMYEAGAHTLAQDEATSIVFGMPYEALTIGATKTLLPIQEIAQAIVELSTRPVSKPVRPSN